MDHTLLENPHHQIGNAMHVGVFVLLQLSVYANTRVHRAGLPAQLVAPAVPDEPAPVKTSGNAAPPLDPLDADLPPAIKFNRRGCSYFVKFKELNINEKFIVKLWPDQNAARSAVVAWHNDIASLLSCFLDKRHRDLKEECIAAGVAQYGNKADLVSRLVRHKMPPRPAPPITIAGSSSSLSLASQPLDAHDDVTHQFLVPAAEPITHPLPIKPGANRDTAMTWLAGFIPATLLSTAHALQTTTFAYLLAADLEVRKDRSVLWIHCIFTPDCVDLSQHATGSVDTTHLQAFLSRRPSLCVAGWARTGPPEISETDRVVQARLQAKVPLAIG